MTRSILGRRLVLGASFVALAGVCLAWSAPPPPPEKEEAPGAFSGRQEGTRAKLLEKAGGNAQSEAAVARGLEWLALHQGPDGSWSLDHFNQHARRQPLPGGKTFVCNCGGLATRKNDVAGTAYGLLPFLAAGYTHKARAGKGGPDYSKTVDAGLRFLLAKQDKKGSFGGETYAHGLATVVVCEAYGMTADPRLKGPAQKALNYIAGAQDPAGGGWRDKPREPGDLFVTGWQLMAIKSGQMAGLQVPKQTLVKCEKFLDAIEGDHRGGYGSMPGQPETPAMTAVGLLCRRYLGHGPRNPGLRMGVEKLKRNPPGTTRNRYYEYYATQVMHHMGGDSWQFWNLGPKGDGKGGIRDTLIARQDSGKTKAHQKGSWDPTGDAYAAQGGRIMSTSLSLLCLEVYYRHLPLYGRRELPPFRGAP